MCYSLTNVFSEAGHSWENTKQELTLPFRFVIGIFRSRVNLRHHRAGLHRNALHWIATTSSPFWNIYFHNSALVTSVLQHVLYLFMFARVTRRQGRRSRCRKGRQSVKTKNTTAATPVNPWGNLNGLYYFFLHKCTFGGPPYCLCCTLSDTKW